MIRFACPRCKSVLKAQDKLAGSKVACPKCQQRLLIPTPPPNKTVLAPLVGHQPNPNLSQSFSPRPEPPFAEGRLDPSPANPAALSPDSSAPVHSPDRPVISNRFWRFRLPSCRFWLGVIAVLPALAIASIFARLLLTGGYIRPAGQVAENRRHTRSEEEELVKAFILNNADKDADKVKFLTWGPHLSKSELVDWAKESGFVELADLFDVRLKHDELKRFEAFRSIVRVRYEGPADIVFQGPFGISQLFDPWLSRHAKEDQFTQTNIHDNLFIVYAKLVDLLSNEGSEDWKLKVRKELSKRFPALKP